MQYQNIQQQLAAAANPQRFAGQQQIADAHYLVWFKGRTTPVIVDADDRSAAISKARKKANRGGDGKVVEARLPTDAEKKTIAGNNWVTTRPKGHENMKSSFKK